MFRKITFILSVLVIGFAAGYGGYNLAFAKHHHPIPGIDIPYNPGAYYSPTALDYEDSPSTFALRDLAANGGNVFDYARYIKDTLTTKNVIKSLKIAIQKTGIDILNLTPFSKGNLEKTGEDVYKMNALAVDNTLTDDVAKLLAGNTFRSADDLYDDDTHPFDSKTQHETVQQTTTDMIQASQNFIASRDEQDQTYQRIMEDVTNAAGEIQVEQAQAEAEAFAQTQQAQRDALLGNFVSLKELKRRIEEDAQLAFQRSSDANMLHFPDPFHRSPVEQKEYESTNPTPPKGFAAFK